MKIIFTVSTYYPLRDGVQHVTQYLAEGMAQRGNDVIVYTGSHGNDIRFEVYNGVKIYRFNCYTNHGIHKGEKETYLASIVAEANNSDCLINVCTQTSFTDWLLPYLDEIKCKKILYMHGMINFKYHAINFESLSSICHKVWNNIRWKYFYKVNLDNLRKYNAIIQLHKEDVGYSYFKKRKFNNLYVIQNAADDEIFNTISLSTSYKSKTPENYVVCVANYSKGKNQLLCLNAFYKANTENYELVFIGGEENDYYKKLIEQKLRLDKVYGIKNVHILAGIKRKEIVEYIQNAKFYLFGSRSEVFPVSIIESMASQVPFISTNVGIVKYLPGGVVVKNESDMIHTINEFISNKSKSICLGNIGGEYAKHHFRIQDKIDDLEKIIKED